MNKREKGKEGQRERKEGRVREKERKKDKTVGKNLEIHPASGMARFRVSNNVLRLLIF